MSAEKLADLSGGGRSVHALHAEVHQDDLVHGRLCPETPANFSNRCVASHGYVCTLSELGNEALDGHDVKTIVLHQEDLALLIV